MSQLKPCPPKMIERAKRQAKARGQCYFVVFDHVMSEFRVISHASYRGCGMTENRHEIVASTK